ncbi:hypothetical protein COCNU_06G020620 [Cocos nucifera]|uniref:Uncharacterized protein n=1 Tax=Cocos nucifera TaxID=13894 RepID=A0A8K0N3Q2_COCNU|nr:hypothetical protein COCNU_06G020620 [Cocos nucifera]
MYVPKQDQKVLHRSTQKKKKNAKKIQMGNRTEKIPHSDRWDFTFQARESVGRSKPKPTRLPDNLSLPTSEYARVREG